MKSVIGNPVRGDDFFDREQEQERIWRKLESNHVMLLAPRRIGKTSLMYRLCETAPEHEFEATMTSFAPCKDEMDCIKALVKAATKNDGKHESFAGKFKEVLKNVKGFTVSGFGAGLGVELQSEDGADWRTAGEALAAALAALDGKQLICVDEFPVFVLKLLDKGNGVERVRSFLYWFRDLRQNHHQRVSWIIAGSIGMDTVASRFCLGDSVNDFDPFPLGAFSEETADAFLDRLAQSCGLPLSPANRQQMIQRLGWPVPYYLQLLFDKLAEQCSGKKPPSRELIEKAFEELLSPAYKVHFDYWRQRLGEELGSPEDGHAVRLLNAVCKDRTGVSMSVLSQVLQERVQDLEQRQELLRYLLDVLESDGYLVRMEDHRFRFRLEWLREYWLRRVA